MIPKFIHQIWVGHKPFPEALSSLSETWKNFNEGWNYKLWRDADIDYLIAGKFPALTDLFVNIQLPVMKADLARYLILFTYGGLYVDLDYECFKPIGELFDRECIIGLEPAEHARVHNCANFIGNAFIACSKNNNFISSLIVQCISNLLAYRLDNTSFDYVMATTGPRMVNTVYNEYVDKMTIRLLESILVSPLTSREICEHLSGSRKYDELIEGAYALHYFNGSWLVK